LKEQNILKKKIIIYFSFKLLIENGNISPSTTNIPSLEHQPTAPN